MKFRYLDESNRYDPERDYHLNGKDRQRSSSEIAGFYQLLYGEKIQGCAFLGGSPGTGHHGYGRRTFGILHWGPGFKRSEPIQFFQ